MPRRRRNWPKFAVRHLWNSQGMPDWIAVDHHERWSLIRQRRINVTTITAEAQNAAARHKRIFRRCQSIGGRKVIWPVVFWARDFLRCRPNSWRRQMWLNTSIHWSKCCTHNDSKRNSSTLVSDTEFRRRHAKPDEFCWATSISRAWYLNSLDLPIICAKPSKLMMVRLLAEKM